MPSTKHPKPTPPLPWKTKLFLTVGSFISDAARRRNVTVNRRLLSLLDRAVPPLSTSSLSVSDVRISPSLSFRLYVPIQTQTPLPVLIFFHGGGFAFLSPSDPLYDPACRRFSLSLPAVVVSVEYRLAPEHKFPAQYSDAFDVISFLNENSDKDLRLEKLEKVADLGRCFVGGDSAGGNIAHNAARMWTEEGKGKGKVVVRGVVAIQPFFGGVERVDSEVRLEGAPLVSVERTDWMWKAFLPQGEDRDHEAVNVFGPRGRKLPAGFPPVLVVVGGFDPLQDWQNRYADGLKERGVEVKLVYYPNAIHAFYLFPEIPESALLIEEIRSFIQSKSSTV